VEIGETGPDPVIDVFTRGGRFVHRETFYDHGGGPARVLHFMLSG